MTPRCWKCESLIFENSRSHFRSQQSLITAFNGQKSLQGQRNVFEPGADKTKSPTMPVAAQNVPFHKFVNPAENQVRTSPHVRIGSAAPVV